MTSKTPENITVENKNDLAFIQLSIPVLVIFKKPNNYVMSPGISSLIPIISRTIRDSFRGNFGDVVVLSAPPIPPNVLPEAFTSLALQYHDAQPATSEESSAMVSQFIVENFDVALIHEMLGGILNKAKEQVGK